MLELVNINKSYSNKRALTDLSVEFGTGVYGILGANGAGKSTMIKLITDTVKRDEGSILYNGEDILKLGRTYRSKVGYMPQHEAVYESFTARGYLMYIASIKGISEKQAAAEADSLLKVFNLTEVAKRKIGTFSGGMKRRTMIAQALMGNPAILILDEPTAGLDPKERIAVRNYIAGLAENRTILYATHIVSDIECIADKVLILKAGQKVAYDTPAKLIADMKGKVWERRCTLNEAKELQRIYTEGSLHQKDDGLYLRIVSDEAKEGFKPVNDGIGLEEVYMGIN